MPLYAHEGAWYGSVSDAVHYVKLYSRSHGAVIRVYDETGQRDRNARADGRFQRVVSVEGVIPQRNGLRRPRHRGGRPFFS
jgi:hypothetical protein